MPNEIEGAVPFAEDHAPRDYDRESASRLREAFAAMLPVFAKFRAGFEGKASPVQLWWGSFDLAVSRFSGKKAPPHPGGLPGLPDRITREAYSHEVTSAGFWASGAAEAEPFFYSYIYPEPDGYRAAKPSAGRFDETYGEFVLPYAEVQAASDPEAMLLGSSSPPTTRRPTSRTGTAPRSSGSRSRHNKRAPNRSDALRLFG